MLEKPENSYTEVFVRIGELRPEFKEKNEHKLHTLTSLYSKIFSCNPRINENPNKELETRLLEIDKTISYMGETLSCLTKALLCDYFNSITVTQNNNEWIEHAQQFYAQAAAAYAETPERFDGLSKFYKDIVENKNFLENQLYKELAKISCGYDLTNHFIELLLKIEEEKIEFSSELLSHNFVLLLNNSQEFLMMKRQGENLNSTQLAMMENKIKWICQYMESSFCQAGFETKAYASERLEKSQAVSQYNWLLRTMLLTNNLIDFIEFLKEKLEQTPTENKKRSVGEKIAQISDLTQEEQMEEAHAQFRRKIVKAKRTINRECMDIEGVTLNNTIERPDEDSDEEITHLMKQAKVNSTSSNSNTAQEDTVDTVHFSSNRL